MSDVISIIISLGSTFGLIALGFFMGRHLENAHYRSIHERERQFAQIPALVIKTPPDPERIESAQLVTGSAVISIDYFKRIAAGIRKIFGGEIRVYSSLLDRARREAMLRMKESCPGAQAFCNIRIETSSISKGQQKTVGSIEVLAYGTAIFYRQ